MSKADPRRRWQVSTGQTRPRTGATGQRIHKAPGTNARKAALLAGAIGLVSICVLVAHWPALSARALCSDDLEYMVDNPLVKNPSWRSAQRFLSEVLRPSTVGGYYQPLSMISLMLDYAMGGREADPRQFHRTSLALHVANTALVVILLWRLFGNLPAAAMVGLLFGAHPMTVEPIPWISERKTLLAAFFALICLVTYARYARAPDWKLYAVCLIAFVLGLMSKPISTPLPVCLLLLDYWPLRRLSLKAVLEKIPFFVIAGVSAAITFYSQRVTFGLDMPSKYSPLRIPLVLCHNIVFYLYKMVWPVDLSPHYPFPQPMDLSHPMVLAGLIGTIVLLAVLIVSLKRTPAPLVGWLFFFAAIFPSMGVIGFTVVVASDKFAYLPSVGLLVPLAGLLAWMQDRWKTPTAKMAVRASIVVIVAVLAAAEIAQTRKTAANWADTYALNRHMLAMAPNSAWVHNCSAVNFIRHMQIDQAVEHLEKSLRIDPAYAEAHNSIGVALDMQGKSELAIKHFTEAIKCRPNYPAARRNLALALAKKGESGGPRKTDVSDSSAVPSRATPN